MRAKREEELLECPVCWESFNLVENVPYILWCGHTLCRTCILALHCATVKFPTLPIQLPFFVSCPWCQLLSFRLIWKGKLRCPSKNYFLLWLVETANGSRIRSSQSYSDDPRFFQLTSNLPDHQHLSIHSTAGHIHEHPRSPSIVREVRNHLQGGWGVCSLLRRSLSLIVHLTAKFPVVAIFLLIVLYVIPASAAILVAYLLITFLFALPSVLVLYFSFPILNWLVREIIA